MKRVVILTLATSLVALSLTSCDSKTKSTTTAAVQTSVLTKVSPVEQVEVAETVDFTTTLLPFKKTFVTPQMSLRIDKILVEVGDHVKKDQLVATLDPNQFNQSNVQLKNAEQNLARMKSVYEAGGVSRSQIDEL